MIAHGGQQAGDFDRAGRGQVRFAPGRPVVDLDCADHSAAKIDRVEDVPQQVGRGRFAVGSGHAQQTNGSARLAKKLMRHPGRGGWVGDHKSRNFKDTIAAGVRAGHDDGDRPAGRGIGDESRAVGFGPGSRNEQITRTNLPGIVANASNGYPGRGRDG